jgi:hypothetical protein
LGDRWVGKLTHTSGNVGVRTWSRRPT